VQQQEGSFHCTEGVILLILLIKFRVPLNTLSLYWIILTSLNSYRLALDQRVVALECQLIRLVIHVKE
jgi:hypothetical protein